MIFAIITAIATACAIPALWALRPHIESYATRTVLKRAHRAAIIETETNKEKS